MVGGPFPEVRKWSRDPPVGPELVGGLSREVRKWSRDPPEGPELVGVPSQRSGIGRGTRPKV